MMWPVAIFLIFAGACVYSVADMFLPGDNDEPRDEK
jgi:hypothetical protein